MTLAEPTRNDAGAGVSRRPVAGVGRVLLWSGGSVWLGREAGLVQPHAHHAIQIALAMTGSFRMRSAAEPDWSAFTGAVVMPHRRHQFDGQGSAVAMLFVEPETVHGRALAQRHASADVEGLASDTVEDLVAPLREGWASGADDGVLAAAGQRAIAALAGPVRAAGDVDPRIGRAIEWLRTRLDTTVSLQQAAAAVHLSPSRFRHLFVAQTGVAFRAYVLWARVESAVGAAMAGRSWTAAAQEAGFADSAHLSRTCRRMFGVAPAMLVRESRLLPLEPPTSRIITTHQTR
jgi:AraC family transcriptional regulator